MLKENTIAPDFCLKDQDNKEHSLAKYKGNWLLIYFYPMNFTPGCTTEACSIRDSFSNFKKLNINILGINNGDEISHKKFSEKHNLTFPLLADPEMTTIKAYKANFLFFTRRISYLINPKGLIAKSYGFINSKNHPTEVLIDIEKFSGLS